MSEEFEVLAVPAPARRGWRLPAVGVVAAAGAACAVVALSAGASGDAHAGPTIAPHSAAVLNVPAMAKTAAPTAKYFYTISSRTRGPGINNTVDTTQTWVPMSGKGKWVVHLTSTGTKKVERYSGTCGVYGQIFSPCESATGNTWGGDLTPAFLAAAPRDPVTLAAQVKAAVIAQVKKDTAEGQFKTPPVMTPKNLSASMINFITVAFASDDGVTPDLSAAFQKVIASLPGVVITHGAKNMRGATGTSYDVSFGPASGEPVIFNANHTYIGIANVGGVIYQGDGGKITPGNTSTFFASGTSLVLGGAATLTK